MMGAILNIRARLVVGFTFILLLLAGAVTATIWNVGTIENITNRIVVLRTPTTMASTSLVSHINGSLTALRSWIYTGNEKFVDQRASMWAEIVLIRGQMDGLSTAWTNPDNVKAWGVFKPALDAFALAQRKIESVAHTIDQYPANKMLFQQAVPRAEAIITQATRMIDIELTLNPTSKRRELLAGMRESMDLSLANIRLYLLSGNSTFARSFEKHWARNEHYFGQLVGMVGQMTSEQQDAFQLLSAKRAEFVLLPLKMLEIRDSEKWDMAQYLLASEAEPIAEKLLTILSGTLQPDGTRQGGMVASQKDLLTQDVQSSALLISTLMTMQWGLLAVGLAVGAVIAVYVVRSITSTTNQLTTAMGSIVINEKGIINIFSQAAENIFGYSEEDVLGRNVKMLMPEPDRGRHNEYMQNYLKTGTAKIIGIGREVMGLRKNGESFPLHLGITEITVGGRKSFVGSITDLTERNRAEEEIRHLRNYLENIIDSMPSALIGVDADGKVTQWNAEAEHITNASKESAIGQPLEQVYPRWSKEMTRVHQVIETRQELTESKRAHQKNGETHYEDLTIYPLVANGVVGAVIRIDDVTEKIRLEEMMIQSEKMLSVGGLAAGMAHEINNPLAGMIQTASVMKNRLENTELPANLIAAENAGTTMNAIQSYMEERSILHMTNRITESGRRVAEIVNNMLSFARKSENAFSSYDIAQLLDKTVELATTDYDLKRAYDFKSITIIREYAQDQPLVPCDAAKLQQVLLNLLRNGAQAMHGAGIAKPAFTLRTDYERESGQVRIEVEDNGPGMDETTRKRIFEPFFTTKPVGVGTGLGLSVSYFIITENHGGEMGVVSVPGAGARFVIRLPLNRSGDLL